MDLRDGDPKMRRVAVQQRRVIESDVILFFVDRLRDAHELLKLLARSGRSIKLIKHCRLDVMVGFEDEGHHGFPKTDHFDDEADLGMHQLVRALRSDIDSVGDVILGLGRKIRITRCTGSLDEPDVIPPIGAADDRGPFRLHEIVAGKEAEDQFVAQSEKPIHIIADVAPNELLARDVLLNLRHDVSVQVRKQSGNLVVTEIFPVHELGNALARGRDPVDRLAGVIGAGGFTPELHEDIDEALVPLGQPETILVATMNR